MSSSTSPYWHQLLRHFENKGYIHNGLTIPFLIGSIEILKPNDQQWTIDKMMESLNSHGCTILKCSNIGEYVIGSLDSETLKNKQLYHCPCDNIVITDSSLNKVNSFTDLKVMFEEMYQLRISKREFSKDSGNWTYFTISDLSRIKETK